MYPIHIFLSFRGADTRENIASLIYDALVRKGFNVFMDDASIRTGQHIDSIIREAINKSKGAVIIFSNDFTSSEWCLDELILILRRKRVLGSDNVLAPIYVDGLQPEDIQDQRGSYSKTLAKHTNKGRIWNWNRNKKVSKKVKAWRAALKEVTVYRGKILNGKLANFINETVNEIQQEFCIQGITVNPRRPCPTEMNEFIKKLAIVGNFIYQNWRLLAVVMLISFFVQRQPHDQFVQPMARELEH